MFFHLNNKKLLSSIAGRHAFSRYNASSRSKRTFEKLEDRLVLSSSPVFLDLPSEITLYEGASYHIALHAASDDATLGLAYDVTEVGDLSGLSALVPEGRSVSITYNETIDGAAAPLGEIVFQLFEDDAPLSTAQFVTLVNNGYYEGLTIHRIIDHFMFQGGNSTAGSGLSDIPDEISSTLQHSSAGIVAYANHGSGSSNSQYYIMDQAYSFLDGGYNVFGFVTEGDDVREYINSVETSNDAPLNAITMSDVTLFQDNANGVLRIDATSSAVGTSYISVRVTDELGNQTTQKIKVTVLSKTDDPINEAVPSLITLEAGSTVSIDLPAYLKLTTSYEGTDYTYSNSVYYSVDTSALPAGVTAAVEKGRVVITDTTGTTQSFTLPITIQETEALDPTSVLNTYSVNATVFVAELDDITLPASVDMVAGETKTVTIEMSEEFTQSGVALKVDPDSLPTGVTASISNGVISITAAEDFAQVFTMVLYVDGAPEVSKTLDVFVSPTAPVLTLLEESDTGSADGITSINNDGETLRFKVTNIFQATGEDSDDVATLVLKTNENQELAYNIVSQSVSADSNHLEFVIAIADTEDTHLADGNWAFVAYQYYPVNTVYTHDPLTSADSNVVNLTVDTQTLAVTTDVSEEYKLSAGVAFSLQLEVNKTDSEGNPRSDVVFSIGQNEVVPEDLTFENGLISWTPDSDDLGWEYSFTVHVADGAGFETSVPITLSLASDVDFDIIGEKTVNETEAVELNLVVNDDEYAGEFAFAVYSSTLPNGADYSLDVEETGNVFRWTTTESDGGGTYTVSFKLTTYDADGNAQIKIKSVELTVNEVNQSPEITYEAADPIQILAGTASSWTITATDADSPAQTLVFSLVGTEIPEGMTIDSATGVLSWTPTEAQASSDLYSVTVRVTDSAEAYDEIVLNFSVSSEETDLPPVFDEIETQQATPGQTLIFTVKAVDPEGKNTIRYSFASEVPSGMTIDEDTGTITWVVPADYFQGDTTIESTLVTIKIKATEIIKKSDSDQDDSGEGDSDQGDSGEGDSDQGDSGEGDSGEGDSGEGDSGEGDSDQGDSGEGDSDQGDSDQGDSGQGDSGQSESENGGQESGNDANTQGEGLANTGSNAEEPLAETFEMMGDGLLGVENDTTTDGNSSSVDVEIDVDNPEYVDQPDTLGTISTWEEWNQAWDANILYRQTEQADSVVTLLEANAAAKASFDAAIVEAMALNQAGKISFADVLQRVETAEGTYLTSLQAHSDQHDQRLQKIDQYADQRAQELTTLADTLVVSNSNEGSLTTDEMLANAYLREEKEEMNQKSEAYLESDAAGGASMLDLIKTQNSWLRGSKLPTGIFRLGSIFFDVDQGVVDDVLANWDDDDPDPVDPDEEEGESSIIDVDIDVNNPDYVDPDEDEEGNSSETDADIDVDNPDYVDPDEDEEGNSSETGADIDVDNPDYVDPDEDEEGNSSEADGDIDVNNPDYVGPDADSETQSTQLDTNLEINLDSEIFSD